MVRLIIITIAIFQLSTEVFSQSDGNKSSVFDYYPWLLEFIDSSDCQSNSISVHGELGGSALIVLRAESGNLIFNERGSVYCRDNANLDCIAFYRLSAPVLEWQCESSDEDPTSNICETPLTREEIVERLLNGQTQFQNGIVVYEYYSEEGGYYYETRNQCAFEYIFVGGFTYFSGIYWSCAGEFICNYGGDVPLPCNPQLNPLGIDLSLATGREIVFQSECTGVSESIVICLGDTIEIASVGGPSGPFIEGPNLEACEFSDKIINSDNFISRTDNGFTVAPLESFRYIITDQPIIDGCAPNQYVYEIIVDQNCEIDPPIDSELFTDYPFLGDLVNPSNCDGVSVSEWEDEGDNRYLYISSENGNGTLYNSSGLLYCRDSPSLSCLAFYTAREVSRWSCDDVIPVDTFALICAGDPLPLLQAPFKRGDFVAACGPVGPPGGPPRVCPCPNISRVFIEPMDGVISDLIDDQLFEVAPLKTTTYTLTATTGPAAPDSPCEVRNFSESFTIVVKEPEECEDNPCICTQDAFPVCGVDGNTYVNACYAACEGVEVAFTGTCEEQDCLQNRGSILLQNCDDGTPFVFIRLGDGEIIDPYFSDSLNVRFNDGTMISFGYEDADFETPCSQASRAVNITCFELIPDCNCITLYDPVCGVDGVTYDNRCTAECLGVEILSEGACDQDDVCDSFNGTILLENCSDGTPFVFIQLENGDIIDPYFPEDLEFDYVEGQFVRFDYEDADFDTPCDQATKAVVLSCIEEIVVDCACTAEYDPVCGIDGQVYSNRCVAACANVDVAYLGECSFEEADCFANSGVIKLENCDDGTSFWFIELSNGDLLDPYLTTNLDFEYYDGQAVSFDYRDAIITTPCSQATKAVYITCIIEDIPDNGGSDDIFTEYDWLLNIVDPNDCEDDTSIEVFDFGSYAFILINFPDRSEMYLNDGTYYCADTESYNCREVYDLTEAASVWNCGNNLNSSNILNEVFINCPGDSALILTPFNINNQAVPCPQGPIGTEPFPCPCTKIGNIQISPETNVLQIKEGYAEYWLFPEVTTTYTITVATVSAHTEDFCITDQFDLIYRVNVLNEGCSLANNANSFARKNVDSEISIVPNPSDGLFNIEYDLQKDEAIKGLDIINVQGQIIYTDSSIKSEGILQVDLSEESGGIYFVRIRTNQSIFTKRILVN